jgi:site-specific DNA-methyltransferase (adenine-specific)
VLERYGWEYIQLVTWDKGIAHIAGNVNGSTIRRFPVVTEVAGLYVRPSTAVSKDGEMTIQEWLRTEWSRAGFSASLANEVCGVKNAASRKWLTADHLWYMPPFEMFEKLRAYANAHGDPVGAPYFALQDGEQWEGSKWTKLRSVWNHTHGLTNVWQVPSLRNGERVKGPDGTYLHTNQKPQELMERQIIAVTNPGDVIWEPFGGLASASVAAKKLGRQSFAAEPIEEFWKAASSRLDDVVVWDF